MVSIVYIYDERDMDRAGSDLVILKRATRLREHLAVSDSTRNTVVRRLLELDVRTILVPSDRYRCSPALVTIGDVMRSLGFNVQRIGEYLYRAPAAYHATTPATVGGLGTVSYRNNNHLSTTR